LVTRPAAVAAGRGVQPHAPSDARRAARPSGAAPASAGQRPVRDGDASPAPLCR